MGNSGFNAGKRDNFGMLILYIIYCLFCVLGKIQKGKQRLELMNSKPEGPPMTQAQTEKNQEQVISINLPFFSK